MVEELLECGEALAPAPGIWLQPLTPGETILDDTKPEDFATVFELLRPGEERERLPPPDCSLEGDATEALMRRLEDYSIRVQITSGDHQILARSLRAHQAYHRRLQLAAANTAWEAFVRTHHDKFIYPDSVSRPDLFPVLTFLISNYERVLHSDDGFAPVGEQVHKENVEKMSKIGNTAKAFLNLCSMELRPTSEWLHQMCQNCHNLLYYMDMVLKRELCSPMSTVNGPEVTTIVKEMMLLITPNNPNKRRRP